MLRLAASQNKNKYIVVFIAASIASFSSVYALDVRKPSEPAPGIVQKAKTAPVPQVAGESVHAWITREALKDTLSAANLKAVIEANDSQDTKGGEGAREKRRHFDGSSIPATLAYINREKTKALNLAAEADTDPQSRGDALRHLGLLLHTMQDFYLHSNYVEIALEDKDNQSDPYNIALVDWNQIPGGYVGHHSGSALIGFKSDDPNDVVNKESSTSGGGKVQTASNISNFSVARDLAVRETQRQWNLFETLLRARCGSRSAAVLAALRQAPPAVQNEP